MVYRVLTIVAFLILAVLSVHDMSNQHVPFLQFVGMVTCIVLYLRMSVEVVNDTPSKTSLDYFDKIGIL